MPESCGYVCPKCAHTHQHITQLGKDHDGFLVTLTLLCQRCEHVWIELVSGGREPPGA